MKPKKKPLYRKLNTKSISIYGHTWKMKYKWYRNSKNKGNNDPRQKVPMSSNSHTSLDYKPLDRFINSKVGENWDDVYSEICKRNGKEHRPVDRFIMTDVTIEDGWLIDLTSHCGPSIKLGLKLYVCPNTNLVKRVDDGNFKNYKVNWVKTIKLTPEFVRPLLEKIRNRSLRDHCSETITKEQIQKAIHILSAPLGSTLIIKIGKYNRIIYESNSVSLSLDTWHWQLSKNYTYHDVIRDMITAAFRGEQYYNKGMSFDKWYKGTLVSISNLPSKKELYILNRIQVRKDNAKEV